MSIRKKEDKGDAKARKAAKEREKRRKKMLRTKYGQKPLKHAKKGVESCLLAALVFSFLIVMIVLSFSAKGDVGIFAGIAGILMLFPAGKGLKMGIKGFGERDKNYITCKIGVICNGLVLLGLAVIFIRGLI